jgi:hypothetical protein
MSKSINEPNAKTAKTEPNGTVGPGGAGGTYAAPKDDNPTATDHPFSSVMSVNEPPGSDAYPTPQGEQAPHPDLIETTPRPVQPPPVQPPPAQRAPPPVGKH